MSRTARAEVDYYTTEGPDREIAHAIHAQAVHQHHPLDDIQVRHLLQIGYRAGRQVSAAEVAFERTDSRHGWWEALIFGLVVGLVTASLAFWVF